MVGNWSWTKIDWAGLAPSSPMFALSQDLLDARDLEERRTSSKYKEILIDFEPQPCGAPCGAPCMAPCGAPCPASCPSPPCSQSGSVQPQGHGQGGRRRHSFLQSVGSDNEILITDPPMDMSPCLEVGLQCQLQHRQDSTSATSHASGFTVS